MAGNRKDSVDSASSTAPNARRRVFPGAWKAFKAKFNYQTAVTPATSSLDGLYVEVFDDMETIVVDSKMDGDKDRVEHKPVTNLEKKVYDLNFLLELGKKATKAPHPLRFSSDAIKQNILKMPKLSKRNDSRARGLSSDSKNSMDSEAEELLFKRTEPNEQKQPYRQPECPPDTPLAQVHAGFRKFLKEHTSPPHNRVTAGGRIVPVGPHATLPPSFNLSSIADVIRGPSQPQATGTEQVPSTTSNVKGHGRGRSSSTTENSSIASTRRESHDNSQLSEASFVTAQANTDLAPGYVPNFPTPLPAGSQVLVKLAHGPTLVAVNNVLFEAISEGVNTVLAPLNGFQFNAQLAPAPMHPSLPMLAPMPMFPAHPMPLMNMTNNVPIAFNQPTIQVQRQALQKQLDDLRAQLDQLDKHVALHRSVIGSFALSTVVAQRRQLVVQIDQTRVAKENLNSPIQMNSRQFNSQQSQTLQVFNMGGNAANIPGHFFPGNGPPPFAGAPHSYGAGFPIHAGIPVQNVSAQFPLSHRVDSGGWKAHQTTRDAEAQPWQQSFSGASNPAFLNDHTATQSIPSGLEYGQDGWKAKKPTHYHEGHDQQKIGAGGNVQGTGYGTTNYDFVSSANWNHRPAEWSSQVQHPQWHAEEDIRWSMVGRERIPLPKAVPDDLSDWEALDRNPNQEDGTTWVDANGRVHWDPDGQRPPVDFEALALANPETHARLSRGAPLTQAEVEPTRAEWGLEVFGQKKTNSVGGPVIPVNNQNAWSASDNGELIRQLKHAYVEDAPETPARYVFNNGSVNGVVVTDQVPALQNPWGLPNLDEWSSKGKSKGSVTSDNSWTTDPTMESPPLPYEKQMKWTWEDGRVMTKIERREYLAAKELAASSAMNSSSEPNNQKEFLRTMLSDNRHPSADAHTKTSEWSEELRRHGLNSAGFPLGSTTPLSSVNKENKRSGSYSDTQQFQNVKTREGERTGAMQSVGGYKDARIFKAGPSIGAPLYEARGHVPQYDGAMDSLSSGAPAKTEASSEASSRRSSGQVYRPGTQAGSKASFNAMAPSFYEPVRRFPASEGIHYEAVDRFFNTVREEERAEIAKYKAQFPFM